MTVFRPERGSRCVNPFHDIGAGAQVYRDVRPGYPKETVARLEVGKTDRVADIGAGTGKLTALLCELSENVWAVEPAQDFRKIFLRALPGFPASRLMPTQAENTGLEDGFFDLVTYGQCWHWLSAPLAAAEAARIMRPGGKIAVLYNQLDVSLPWVLQLTRIMRSGDVHREDRPPQLGRRFTHPELVLGAMTEKMTVEEVFALGTTRSSWIGSDAENRRRMRENLRWYLCEELGFDPQNGVISLPYRTLLWTARLK